MKVLSNSIRLILGIVVCGCSSQSILIEPVGPSDKPLPTIELTTDRNLEVEYWRADEVLVFSRSTLMELSSFYDTSFANYPMNYELNGYPYGSYQVTVRNGKSDSAVYLFLGNEESLFFCRKNQSIELDSTFESKLRMIESRLER